MMEKPSSVPPSLAAHQPHVAKAQLQRLLQPRHLSFYCGELCQVPWVELPGVTWCALA